MYTVCVVFVQCFKVPASISHYYYCNNLLKLLLRSLYDLSHDNLSLRHLIVILRKFMQFTVAKIKTFDTNNSLRPGTDFVARLRTSSINAAPKQTNSRAQELCES